MAAYFYAQLDANNIVIGVSQLSGEVTDAHMINLQSYDTTLIGKQYDSTTKTFNAVPPPVPTLDQAKTAKIAELRADYANTLAVGFSATVSGTSYTFGWTDSDISHMNATQQAVSKGFLTFPILYADVNGNPVSIPDQTTLDSIEQAATQFMLSKHQEVLNLVGQVNSATTVTAVNAITWS